MSTALISPEDYLAREMTSEGKHEYVNGMVYAMADGIPRQTGETERHNLIAGNILGILHARLRGRPCRPFGSDMLLKVERGDDVRFYYPDVSIICRLAGPTARVQTEPSVIFEVLSESTARVDTGQKRLAYLAIPSLEAYVLVDSERRAVTEWRRKDGRWVPMTLTDSQANLEFASAGCSLTVAEIYEGTGL
jgi:Uma2 family endonuclease